MNQAARIQPGERQRREIRLRGIVQGVGFRPHVHRCAERLGLSGLVSNGPEGVTIEVEGRDIDAFVALLLNELPPLARVDKLIERPLAPTGGEGFRIAETQAGAAAGAAIPADTALCSECLAELFDPTDRRYLHPFIACCNCGPRYSMTRQLPYDRVNTAMAAFDMCPACAAEYADPSSRRFHAEPVACHDCGPGLSDSVAAMAAAIAGGEIVAIKGVGGYHLVCDARNPAAVSELRRRKRRDGKPFAVMALNAASAEDWVTLSPAARQSLCSAERPIVIAPARPAAGELCEGIARGLGSLGVMLPYTAVHFLLFHALLGGPAGQDWLRRRQAPLLLMTSGNISGEPLACSEAEAERSLAGIADRFLHHDRAVTARIDDTVLRSHGDAVCLVRRARGFAPHAIQLARSGQRVIALGAHLKTTMALTHGEWAQVSPHVGDLDSPAALAFHQETAAALQDMLRARPGIVACDLGRDLASTRLAEQIAAQHDLPLVRVQHHHAHIAAVLAEHRCEEPALGVALDGHGTGLDGTAWGGELLLVDGATLARIGHLANLPLPGGDRAAREPWRMAAAALHRLGRGDEITERFAQQSLARDVAAWLAGGEVPGTSAAGRLFDAAAGMLGLCDCAEFEGQAPMLLEAAIDQCETGGDTYDLGHGVLDFLPLLDRLADEPDAGRGAAAFHATLVNGLVDWVRRAARDTGLKRIVLSGGCFLNAYLASNLPPRLEALGLTVMRPQAMPPNDGAISLGQAWVAQRSDEGRA